MSKRGNFWPHGMYEISLINWRPTDVPLMSLQKEASVLATTTWWRICVRFIGFANLVTLSSLMRRIRFNAPVAQEIVAAVMAYWRRSWPEPRRRQDATEFLLKPIMIQHRRFQTVRTKFRFGTGRRCWESLSKFMKSASRAALTIFW